MSETPARPPTVEQLIREIGVRRYSKCGLCGRHNMWEIDGEDKLPPAKVCSWCDVEHSRKWEGLKGM